MELLNIFATEAESEAAQNNDHIERKEANRLAALAKDNAAGLDDDGNPITSAIDAWTAHYAITNSWGHPPRQTIDGSWTYPVCPEATTTYNTVEYSPDLFLVVEE